MDPMLYWIWLAEVCGPDSPLPTLLWEHVGVNVRKIYQMTRADYEALGVLKDTQITALSDKDLRRPQRILDQCARHSVGVLSYDSRFYPERLRRIQHPPLVLYYRGSLPDFDKRLSIAVVGTRGMTEEGRICAYRLSYDLAVAGTVIVSGMALGIDGIAQIAALDANGTSVAVLGTAIDRCYPQEHQPLYERLLCHGCLFSEYPPGTDTHSWHFPQRNRIISGLCQGTLVVEAGRRSGALITAQAANAQGRTLYAVPGDPGVPARVGTNDLIKSGAVPVTSPMDILSRYANLYDTCIYPGNIDNPAYYQGYDDTLKYGRERVEQRRQAQAGTAAPLRSSTVPAAEAYRQDHTASRNIPAYTEPREEPLTEHIPPKLRTAPNITAVQPPLQEPPVTAVPPDMPASAETLLENLICGEPAKTDPAEHEPSRDAQPLLYAKNDTVDIREAVLHMIEENCSFDEMCARGYTAADLMVTLTLLEIDGDVTVLPGGQYKRK